jgi:hypothetical protein
VLDADDLKYPVEKLCPHVEIPGIPIEMTGKREKTQPVQKAKYLSEPKGKIASRS